MEIRINEMKLQNFKGIQDLQINPGGNIVEIRGDNATGKTSILDAFLWILTGKNSLGQTDFDIVPHDANHKSIDKLDTVVELSLQIDKDGGKQELVTLKKLLQQKWSRPRGQSEEVYGGTKTSYFINKNPKQKNQFDKILAQEIVQDEKVFKLLTNVRYFNEHEQLSWKERRDLLFQLVPALKDSEIINANKQFESLKNIANFDNFESVSRQNVKLLKNLQIEINAKISENQELLKNSESKADAAKLKEVIEAGEVELAGLRKEIVALLNSGETEKFEQQKLFDQQKWEIDSKKQSLLSLTATVENMEAEVEKQERINNSDARMLEQFRNAVIDKKKAIKNYQPSATCPTCHQYLPKSFVNEAYKEYVQQINLEIAEMTKKGMSLKENVQETTEWINNALDTILAKKAEMVKLSQEVTTLEQQEQTKPVESPNNAQLLTEKQTEIDKKEEALQPIRQELAKIESRKDIQERIAKHETKYQDVGKQLISIEQQLELIKQFRIEKNKIMANRINSLFQINQFELFETTIDGTEKETYTTLVRGQQYETNANGAGRIQSGIELCEVFAKHYDLYLPLFIDNAESIVDIPATQAQQIRLIVDENFKKLNIMYGEND